MRKIAKKIGMGISEVPVSQQVLFDCGHHIHDYEYERITLESKEFIKNIIK
ncbi:hypothetical protein CLK_3597 [Clostridium botulinum A3 str. Loch Maree]|uniref:hypothetical protein n=1 Tax=Clostridium botulinum TaxID=1491 RepID=UPI000170FD5A|nr:hypothetical protein [Clostridium botulinum]ACA55024.1 hypothetical protein CLK_3597 [Clostridium botulinum A3 str. Loch Maree]